MAITQKQKTTVIVCATHDLDRKVSWRNPLCGEKEFLKKNQRGITWKLNKGEQPFLRTTHRLDLIHMRIKFHEDIPNG